MPAKVTVFYMRLWSSALMPGSTTSLSLRHPVLIQLAMRRSLPSFSTGRTRSCGLGTHTIGALRPTPRFSSFAASCRSPKTASKNGSSNCGGLATHGHMRLQGPSRFFQTEWQTSMPWKSIGIYRLSYCFLSLDLADGRDVGLEEKPCTASHSFLDNALNRHTIQQSFPDATGIDASSSLQPLRKLISRVSRNKIAKGCGAIRNYERQIGRYPCSFCGRLFKTVADLFRHEEIVFPEQFWFCFEYGDPEHPYWNHLFTTKDKYRDHITKVHAGHALQKRRLPADISRTLDQGTQHLVNFDQGDDDDDDDPDDDDDDDQSNDGGPQASSGDDSSADRSEDRTDKSDDNGPEYDDDPFNSIDLEQWLSSEAWRLPLTATIKPLSNTVKSECVHQDVRSIRWLGSNDTIHNTASVFSVALSAPMDNPESCRSQLYTIHHYHSHQHDLYEQTVQAYTLLQGHEFKRTGMVRCYGTFEYVDESGRSHYNIVLQHGERNLWDYWKVEERPRTKDGIVKFWTSLRAVADGVLALHKIQILDDGKVLGNHAGIGSENILLVDGVFTLDLCGSLKLADSLGIDHDPKCHGPKRFSSQTYAAPELCDYRCRPSGGTTQASDIWSLNCVFLEVATWVRNGMSELRQFNKHRRQHLPLDSNVPWRPPFHNDGITSEAVRHWILRLHFRGYGDNQITPNMLRLVKQCLLLTDPQKGLPCKLLRTSLDIVISISDMQRTSPDTEKFGLQSTQEVNIPIHWQCPGCKHYHREIRAQLTLSEPRTRRVGRCDMCLEPWVISNQDIKKQELSTAIEAMSRWYRDANRAYAWLADERSVRERSMDELLAAKWFSRRWVLQELVITGRLGWWPDWDERRLAQNGALSSCERDELLLVSWELAMIDQLRRIFEYSFDMKSPIVTMDRKCFFEGFTASFGSHGRKDDLQPGQWRLIFENVHLEYMPDILILVYCAGHSILAGYGSTYFPQYRRLRHEVSRVKHGRVEKRRGSSRIRRNRKSDSSKFGSLRALRAWYPIMLPEG
ncbi:hypothetical protein EK21DRAFT_94764 [Setomelanomma holmii]|uniref:Protein kinase domain-containing protein n=1 Tax=Setomelanomma holmii TaxID=210430 RepID=A0A9P4GXP0_9PLEO|nr:hypothetical protein EK21DRAFT_94764 [Setomelanomma holmii]